MRHNGAGTRRRRVRGARWWLSLSIRPRGYGCRFAAVAFSCRLHGGARCVHVELLKLRVARWKYAVVGLGDTRRYVAQQAVGFLHDLPDSANSEDITPSCRWEHIRLLTQFTDLSSVPSIS